jgi:hypothetical protein
MKVPLVMRHREVPVPTVAVKGKLASLVARRDP